MVYKVVEFQGTPRMKFSEEIEKITIPGSKSVVRIYDEAMKPQFDLLCLQSEVEEVLKNENELKYFLKKKLDSESVTMKPHTIKQVTQLLFKDGKRAFKSPALKDRRAKVVESL